LIQWELLFEEAVPEGGLPASAGVRGPGNCDPDGNTFPVARTRFRRILSSHPSGDLEGDAGIGIDRFFAEKQI
jgi:hypothetical protein